MTATHIRPLTATARFARQRTLRSQAFGVAERLASARRAGVLSGAGLSAESGIPTFRTGAGALWHNFWPEDLATPGAFRRDPALVWGWYRERITALQAARPNHGHVALVRIAAAVPHFSVITQNVDGLHDAAGSADVIELHGNITQTRCTQCGLAGRCDRSSLPGLPRCACGGLLRPGVVWFGEALPPGPFERAEAAAARSDVFLVAGTSAVVYPAAGLIQIAKSAGAFVVEINPQTTDASTVCDLSVRAKSGAFLPLVADALESLRGARS